MIVAGTKVGEVGVEKKAWDGDVLDVLGRWKGLDLVTECHEQ